MSVSVVIPCYGGATLPRTLASIRAQTLPALEIIVVDDASPVPVEAPGARVIRLERNGGPADARNAGWDAARGKYVAFLDSDDAWHPRKLEWQSKVMEENPRLALTATGLFESRTDPAVWPACDSPPKLASYSRARSLLVNPSHPPTWMVRRELPRRFPRGVRYVEDYLFLLELLLDGEPIQHLDAQLACVFKPRLGRTTGLSSQLWKMERGELSVYQSLHASGRLSFASAKALQAASLVKFGRRLALRVLR
ncbi:MAG TPA: glycosyltransferase family 2 protein [Myxococcales bacterium]|jgi:glycosyltransferase involved in cell wall biosynthesis|nr:glycosyltransferase family 2 protein [Myxococcales bacterium]